MVYLLKMVIFHGYVSHNQMVNVEAGKLYTSKHGPGEGCSILQEMVVLHCGAYGSKLSICLLEV
jgi:hypothetical protein